MSNNVQRAICADGHHCRFEIGHIIRKQIRWVAMDQTIRFRTRCMKDNPFIMEMFCFATCQSESQAGLTHRERGLCRSRQRLIIRLNELRDLKSQVVNRLLRRHSCKVQADAFAHIKVAQQRIHVLPHTATLTTG